jgi:ABC-type multidrug transport system ATPase subunit
MSKTIQICDDLSLPLDIITMRTAVYGDSGAGKTTFARLLAEKIHDAHHRFCAIDLKNDWWGLKSSADGPRPGSRS